MNREDIISMAREVGIKSPDTYKLTVSHMSVETLERFFQAAYAAGAAAEREELARFFKDHWRETWTDLQISKAIRARGKA